MKLPPATLRAWVLGRPYPTRNGSAQFRPLIRAASVDPPLLSFWNLIEAHVLRALRTDHGISITAVRQAVSFAERDLGIDCLLLRPELRTNAGRLFLERYGQLINLSASGQLAMRQLFEAHLQRVRWDEDQFPFRLHPFLVSSSPTTAMPIVIDPAIAFGRPVVLSRGIPTRAIVDRIDAGERREEVAKDYDLTPAEVDQAVLYERAAAWEPFGDSVRRNYKYDRFWVTFSADRRRGPGVSAGDTRAELVVRIYDKGVGSSGRCRRAGESTLR